MDNRFLTAFLAPQKFKVGGFFLDAFCLRHLITLQAIESPLVTGAREPDSSDLVIAIKVCSSKSVENISKIGFWEKIKFSKIYNDIYYQLQVALEFKNYMTESMSVPKVWVKENNDEINVDNKEKFPKEALLIVGLMAKLNFTEEQALNMPFSRVVWYLTAYACLEGSKIETISTSDEDKELEEKKKLESYEKEMFNKLKSNKLRKDVKVL